MGFTQSEKDAFLSKLIDITEANLCNEHFGVSELAREIGMSRSNLHRKVKSALNISVSQLIKEIRLKKSAELLRDTSLTISEVAYKSGFQSLSYFSKSFRNYFGYTPSDLKSNKETTIKLPNIQTGNLRKRSLRDIPAFRWFIFILVASAIVVFIGLLFNPFKGDQIVAIKSIAVLPFHDDSPLKDNAHITNGFMEAILNKLVLIQDLNVVSRTSVEKYRASEMNIKEIGRELNVNYILEGSSQTIKGKTVIRLQLIDAVNDKHLWSRPFMKEITLDNIFDLQEEVALEVANELEVVMASGEREQLGSIPTNNIEAYSFYLLGKDFMNAHLYSKDINEKDQALIHAKSNFEKAIELDSSFADAYSILGSIFIINLYNKEAANNWDKASKYLDSGLVMLNKALYYDRDNTQALASKAAYYELKGIHEEANPIYETISKNGYMTFEFGVSRYNSIDDYYNTINNYIRYLRAKPKDIIVPPYLLRMMIVVFRKAGFPELENQLIEQLFSFNNDTLEYLNELVMYENWQGNYRAALNYGLESLKLDSTDSFSHLVLAIHYTYLNDYKNAFRYVQNFDRINLRTNGELQPSTAAGYIYLKNGEEKKAEYHLRESIPRWQTQIEFNTHTAQAFYYLHELAGVYIALGKKEEAMEYLEEMKNLRIIDRVQITILNNWPNFDIIRNEPEFQDVIKVLDARYQKEHQRIENLLIREGIINS